MRLPSIALREDSLVVRIWGTPVSRFFALIAGGPARATEAEGLRCLGAALPFRCFLQRNFVSVRTPQGSGNEGRSKHESTRRLYQGTASSGAMIARLEI